MEKPKKKPLIIITGASSGIGAATAKVFHDAGHPLLLLARNADKMKSFGLQHAICKSLDVTDFKQFAKIIQKVEKQYDTIGCLINNAGIIELGDFTTTDIEKERHVVNVNIMGVINGVKIILPYMQKQKFGTVINISSIGDRINLYGSTVYCATKAALKSLTESWRQGNFDKNIRFCNLAPGYVDTPIWNPYTNTPRYEKLKKANELITAKEFAEMILWVYLQPQHISIRDMVVTPTNSEI